jgi:hypothetical protein
MKPWKITIVAAVLMLLTACNSTNPLIGPFDTFLNVTGGPYIEEKLVEDLANGRLDETQATCRRLELQALRALLLEAKGEANVE